MKLVIAEKPSVAMSLAAVLGATERKDGYLEGSGLHKTNQHNAGSHSSGKGKEM